MDAANLDPSALFGIIHSAFMHKSWGILGFALINLVVWGVRSKGGSLPWIGPKIEPWLKHPIVSVLMPVVGSSSAAVLTALIAGQPMLDALRAGFNIGTAAVFAFVFKRKVDEAKTAGKAAADGVKTLEDAAKVLGGGK